MGWSVQGSFLAWVVYLDADIILILDYRITYDLKEAPLSASEAVELLIELCTLFGLALATYSCVGLLMPSIVAILAVLLILFYRFLSFTPRLSLCLFNSRGPTTAKVDVISI